MSSNTAHKSLSGSVRSPIWNIGLKVLVSSFLAYLIYAQVVQKEGLDQFWANLLQQMKSGKPVFVILSVLLVPINFICENVKWRRLLTSVENLSWWASMKSILTGSTLGIFTPNRLGEYGGRVLYVPAKDNWKVVYATAVGNLAQLIVLLSFGWIGTLYFFGEQIEIPSMIKYASIFLGIAGMVVLGLFYFNIDIIIQLINRITFLKKVKHRVASWKAFQHMEILRSYDMATLLHVLKWSSVKYLVYSTQYLLLLWFFGVDVPIFLAFAGIASIYLIQTAIPLPAFIGLVVRGELALLIWGHYSDNVSHILGAAFTLWIINLLIPSIIGLLLIYKVNILKSLGYD